MPKVKINFDFENYGDDFMEFDPRDFDPDLSFDEFEDSLQDELNQYISFSVEGTFDREGIRELFNLVKAQGA